ASRTNPLPKAMPVLLPFRASVGRSMLFVALSVPGLPAQWYSLPLNSPQQVIAGNWCLAHDTGAGLAVFSAIAQTWTTISPAGSTFAYTRDAVIVTRESPTTLRAWSAFTNSTATQTASATSTFQAINDAAYAMV